MLRLFKSIGLALLVVMGLLALGLGMCVGISVLFQIFGQFAPDIIVFLFVWATAAVTIYECLDQDSKI